MPGADWHRDTTFVVEEGSGLGTLVDPRGLYWSAAGGNALYASDFGKNWVQKLSATQSSTGFYFLDGGQSGESFNGPTDVVVDLQGFIYLCDTGNRRVARYAPDQEFVQIVNVEPDAQGGALVNPVAVAADDSLVYVADGDLAKVIRYQRRK
jgi:sugar lactone lactonase YvrE